MEDLQISVALCTYNGSRFLREQLESIAAQTRHPNELVICDDRSTDDTAQIIKSVAKKAPFPVRFEFNQENLGSNKNFERAVGICQGEIIALSDQDDVWEPRKLEVIAGVFNERPEIGYVFSDAKLIDEDGKFTGQGLWESFAFHDSVFEQFRSGVQVAVLLRRSLVTGATMAFRSRLKSFILPFSPYFVHDSWIAAVASCVGEYGFPISERLIRYRQHRAQQIGARRKSILERVAMVRKGNEDELNQAKLGMLHLRDRLRSTGAQRLQYNGSWLHLVEEKLEHCSRRVDAHEQRGLARLYEVVAETSTGRYLRFSNSWRSIFFDLLF
jgi:glycosyltransferase involved in cell wall biosynthesis